MTFFNRVRESTYGRVGDSSSSSAQTCQIKGFMLLGVLPGQEQSQSVVFQSKTKEESVERERGERRERVASAHIPRSLVCSFFFFFDILPLFLCCLLLKRKRGLRDGLKMHGPLHTVTPPPPLRSRHSQQEKYR